MSAHRRLNGIFAAAACLIATSGIAAPTVRCVPNTGISQSCQSGYGTIGAAVTAASAGDVILVGSGTYAEVVSIPTALTGLSLLGTQTGVDPRLGTRANAAAESVIDASSLTDSAVIVQATNVLIDGFTVQGGIAGSANGIDLKGSGSGFTPANGARVLNNILQNNSVGLALNGEGFGTVDDVVIQQNVFRNNNAGTPTQAGDGIFSSACQNVVINDNTFTGNKRLAIGINNASGVTISNNLADGEGRFVVFTGTSHSSVVRNTGTGLVNTGSLVNTARAAYVLLGYNNSYVTVSDNTLSGGEPGSTIRGIQLGGYGPAPVNTNITVSNNTIRSMPLHAIVAEQGLLTNSVIVGNQVSGSGTDGIFIDSSNTGNVVSRNVSTSNGGMDCRDNSTGSGTAGTANIWLKNIGPTRTPAGICQSETVADFNADTKGDVALQRTNGDVAVWLMNGNNIMTGMGIGTPGSSLKVVATGDFNGDGKADLLLQDSGSGDVVEWQMDGAAVNAARGIGSPGMSWKVVGAGDFNGDGMSDVLLQNSSTGDVVEWQMNGFNIISGVLIGSPGVAWKVVATGDFNGDGKADILLQNSSSGAVMEWQMNGNTIVTGVVINSPAAAWHVVAAGDFNGDGKSDVLLQNSATGDVAEWQMNGTTVTSGRVIGTPGMSWVALGSSDFNGDGKWDVLLQNPSTGDVVEWQMNGYTITSGVIIGSPTTAWSVVAAK